MLVLSLKLDQHVFLSLSYQLRSPLSIFPHTLSQISSISRDCEFLAGFLSPDLSLSDLSSLNPNLDL